MLKFLADENLDGSIMRGLQRRHPESDIVRVQDIGLSGQEDPAVLERAAVLGRVLLKHDAATIPEFAFARVGMGQVMSGVLIIRPQYGYRSRH